MTLSDETLARMRKAAEEANEGDEWKPGLYDGFEAAVHVVGTGRLVARCTTYGPGEQLCRHDLRAAHIAASSPANVLALLDEVERLRRERCAS